MSAIRELFVKVNEVLKTYMEPILKKLVSFLDSGEYIIIATICFFASILILIGLFRWLRKAPKFFFFIIILCGLLIGAWIISK